MSDRAPRATSSRAGLIVCAGALLWLGVAALGVRSFLTFDIDLGGDGHRVVSQLPVPDDLARAALAAGHEGSWIAVKDAGAGLLFTTHAETGTSSATVLESTQRLKLGQDWYVRAQRFIPRGHRVHAVVQLEAEVGEWTLFRVHAVRSTSYRRDAAPVLTRFPRRGRVESVGSGAADGGRHGGLLIARTLSGIVAGRDDVESSEGWLLIWDSVGRRALWSDATDPTTRVSFLALLGDDGEVDPDDLDCLADRVRGAPVRNAAERRMLPAESELLAALDDPRKSVRAAAARVIEAGGEAFYPLGVRELARRAEAR